MAQTALKIQTQCRSSSTCTNHHQRSSLPSAWSIILALKSLAPNTFTVEEVPLALESWSKNPNHSREGQSGRIIDRR